MRQIVAPISKPMQWAAKSRPSTRALGWTEIDAIVVQAEGHLEAELIEIDENLVRSELSVAQRAHYSKRRKEIWEALHPEPSPDYSLESYDADDELEVAQLEPPQVFSHGGARPQTKGFAAATAEVTGESKAQINRNVARAEAIGEGQKVLLAHLGQGWNAGASFGSFSAPIGSCFDRPKTEAVFIVENYLFGRGADTKLDVF